MPIRYRTSPTGSWHPINADTWEFIAPVDTANYHRVDLFAHTAKTGLLGTVGLSDVHEQYIGDIPCTVTGIITGYEIRERDGALVSYNGSDPYQTIHLEIKVFTVEDPSGGEWRPLFGGQDPPYLLPGMSGNNNLVVTFFPLGGTNLNYTNACVLRAYLGEDLVFSRLFDGCPYVEIYDQPTCPPDTCEVDCGTHVCCYGSDGISVFSYQK